MKKGCLALRRWSVELNRGALDTWVANNLPRLANGPCPERRDRSGLRPWPQPGRTECSSGAQEMRKGSHRRSQAPLSCCELRRGPCQDRRCKAGRVGPRSWTQPGPPESWTRAPSDLLDFRPKLWQTCVTRSRQPEDMNARSMVQPCLGCAFRSFEVRLLGRDLENIE